MTGKSYRRGVFDESSLTVQFGGPKSKAENVFTAQAIHIPPEIGYTLDGEQKLIENEYAVMLDGKCIGVIYPTPEDHKCNLYEYAVLPARVIQHVFKSNN